MPAALPAAAHEPITTKVLFNKEVVRILQRSCLGCHRPDGIAMSLATYEEARPWAKAIKEEILNRRMPPWGAVTGFGDFRNAPPLTKREIDLLVNWVEGGAPKGAETDLPAGSLFPGDWPLGNPDLILQPANANEIGPDAEKVITVNFSTNLREARWLTAIDFNPGARSVVHCAKLFLESERPDGAAQGNGSDKLATLGVCLGTWVPGQKTVALTDGAGRLIGAGARIVAIIHYLGKSVAASDRSQIGLYFAKVAPQRQVRDICLDERDTPIPARKGVQRTIGSFTVDEDAVGVAIRPAVSPLIVSMQVTAYRPDGTEEILLWSRGYHSDWEPVYYFTHPPVLPKGTRIEVITYFDNSDANRNNPYDPPRAVSWRDLSAEPLCALTVSTARKGID